MYLFPTRQWVRAYGRLLAVDPVLSDIVTGWGRRFDGEVRLVITDLPLSETTLGDLPERVLADVPSRLEASIADVTLADAPSRLDGTVRTSLPPTVQDLLAQIESVVVDGRIRVRIGLDSSQVRTVILDGPDDSDADAVVSGPYRTWQRIVDGRPAASALLCGDLDVDGPGVLHVQFATLLQRLGDVAADVETIHLFESPRPSLGEVVLDEAVRHPVLLERHLLRGATLATRAVPFL